MEFSNYIIKPYYVPVITKNFSTEGFDTEDYMITSYMDGIRSIKAIQKLTGLPDEVVALKILKYYNEGFVSLHPTISKYDILHHTPKISKILLKDQDVIAQLVEKYGLIEPLLPFIKKLDGKRTISTIIKESPMEQKKTIELLFWLYSNKFVRTLSPEEYVTTMIETIYNVVIDLLANKIPRKQVISDLESFLLNHSKEYPHVNFLNFNNNSKIELLKIFTEYLNQSNISPKHVMYQILTPLFMFINRQTKHVGISTVKKIKDDLKEILVEEFGTENIKKYEFTLLI